METDVILPKLGLTMESGTIVHWLKAPGETVEPGEALFEVESDKSVQEVEASVGGVLVEILVAEGESAPVAAVVARIGAPGSGAALVRKAGAEPAGGPPVTVSAAQPATPAAAPQSAPRPGGGGLPARRLISWRARQAARQAGLDPQDLPPGSGPAGRIVERDVLAALAGAAASDPFEWQAPTHAGRLTAERMAQSFASAPHFYLTVEVNAERLLAYRQAKLDEAGAGVRLTVRLTISDLLVQVLAQALRAHPRANAAWVDGRIRLNREVHIGLATATPQGLMVPVIHHPGRLALAEIARERARLVEKAQANRLSPDELAGGSFTLSNLGMYAVDTFQAILNPPQSAILAVGRIKPRPYVGEEGLGVKPTCFLTLSCDHRVLDGVTAAAFLQRVVELIEVPEGLGQG